MVGVVHAEELLEENRVSKEKEEQDAEEATVVTVGKEATWDIRLHEVSSSSSSSPSSSPNNR